MNGNSHWMTYLLIGIGVLAVAAVDYLTGTELRVFPLYFIPLLLAAWYLPRVPALVAALIVTGAWAFVNFLTGRDYSQAWIWFFNTGMQAVVFLLVTLLFARVRDSLRLERELSRTDPLTGLPNSRSFFERAGSVLAICHRDSQPATLAYIDLDNFKNANDRLGHQAGDALLRKVADVLNENLRSSDIAARLGGDEFAVLLPETGEETAAIALEKVRSRLASDESFLKGEVTASIGAIACRAAPKDINFMIKAADRIMYRAKAAAKDHVIVQGMEPT
ncbi:MAG TPA: diguanylate cyclase [Gammaproteobacteria bacterium]